jgi:hypothetical protein
MTMIRVTVEIRREGRGRLDARVVDDVGSRGPDLLRGHSVTTVDMAKYEVERFYAKKLAGREDIALTLVWRVIA